MAVETITITIVIRNLPSNRSMLSIIPIDKGRIKRVISFCSKSDAFLLALI